MKFKAYILIIFFILQLLDVVYGGPVLCGVCAASCAVGCSFTLWGAGACTLACFETICAPVCIFPTP